MGNQSKPTLDLDEMLEANSQRPDFKPLKNKMIFYYDETNNFRKFKFNGSKYNSSDALDKDFVLGGIAFEDGVNLPDPNRLITDLGLQRASELKFRNLSKSEDFLSIMGSRRTTIFLQWLCDNNLYIHYDSMNNLYYALVDIIDSGLDMNPEYDVDFRFRFVLKESFYDFAKEHLQEMTYLLILHGYPEIKTNDIPSFCTDLADLINSDDEISFEMEYIRQLMKSTSRSGEMPYLSNNVPLTLIPNYSSSYLSKLWMFKNSYHVFDQEPTVQEILNGLEILDGNEVCTRFEFKDSKNDRFLQISDAFVGLMGRYFSFINGVNIRSMEDAISDANPLRIENLKRLNTLIDRSDNKNTTLLTSINGISEVKKRGLFLQYVGSL